LSGPLPAQGRRLGGAGVSALPQARLASHYMVHLPEPDDFEFWREQARTLVQCEVPPDRIAWVEPGLRERAHTSTPKPSPLRRQGARQGPQHKPRPLSGSPPARG
jgi:hypothetical protein